MTSRTIRFLFATFAVAAAVGVLPAAASATTTYASFSDVCRVREYPPESCLNSGANLFEVGWTNGGDSLNVFNVNWYVPTGNEVCEATFRVTNPWAMTGTVEVGDAGPNWDASHTWYTYDVWSEVTTWESYSPGSAGEDEVDVTDEIADLVANNRSWVDLTVFGPGASNGYLSDPELEIEYAPSC
ncbi:hypothetical protein OJ997_09460 [Solirubrobacter phytolaccae]|uniref:Uncharacterized protein n=1 Tax=Solirubrobacter phytolaccae TaxID=1404360 RepID=A0A9X3N619_9ACTN|nr:hypothetical protein [Solirubrobacter phytolaccae]MDA0180520.1 hypothetical protein [Solirubrobacter phytolaccae]